MRMLMRLLSVMMMVIIPTQVLKAQTYPSKPVRLIVPFQPGAGADFVARLFLPGLTKAFGQPFIAENHGGAAGAIGLGIAARAEPDGYTLVTISGSHAINQAIAKDLKYDLTKDFDTIALLASTPWTLAVNPSVVPVRNLKELVSYAKAHPGKLTFGSSGSGSGTHLAGELLKLRSGIDMLHVPYKGTAPAISDLVSGRIAMTFASQVMPQVKAGRLRAIAITSSERSPMAPDIPTMIESGYPNFDVGAWFAIDSPAGVPANIIKRLNDAVNEIVKSKPIQDRLMAQSSAIALTGSPQQASAYVRDNISQWKEIITKSAIKLK